MKKYKVALKRIYFGDWMVEVEDENDAYNKVMRDGMEVAPHEQWFIDDDGIVEVS